MADEKENSPIQHFHFNKSNDKLNIPIINFLIVKSLVKTKYENIINFAANEELIPELLQSNCNAKNIFKYVDSFLENPDKIKKQIEKVQTILKEFKTNKPSAELASLSLNKFL